MCRYNKTVLIKVGSEKGQFMLNNDRFEKMRVLNKPQNKKKHKHFIQILYNILNLVCTSLAEHYLPNACISLYDNVFNQLSFLYFLFEVCSDYIMMLV